MKRKRITCILTVAYEVFRGFTFLVFDFNNYSKVMPLSWYISISALILPAILMHFVMNEEGNTWFWCFSIVTAAQDVGMVKYLLDSWNLTTVVYEYYLRDTLIPLVSFLVIDAILIMILFILSHKDNKRKDINADNSSCER